MKEEIEDFAMKKAYSFDDDHYKKAFYNHKVNGIHLNFQNGNGLSTIWGSGTYSDNFNYDGFGEDYSPLDRIGSNTCEVMPKCSDEVKQKLDKMFPESEEGSIFIYLTFESWLRMVNFLNENA